MKHLLITLLLWLIFPTFAWAEHTFSALEKQILLGNAKAAVTYAENTASPELKALRWSHALTLLERDAISGEAYALLRLARYWVDSDSEKAMNWLHLALALEYPPAKLLAAEWSFAGLDTRLSHEQALPLLHEAAQTGEPGAWKALAKAYASGAGGSLQPHLAKRAFDHAQSEARKSRSTR